MRFWGSRDSSGQDEQSCYGRSPVTIRRPVGDCSSTAVRFPGHGRSRRALDLGIALTPEDRRAEGLVLALSGAVNVILTDPSQVSVGPVVRRSRLVARASDVMGGLAFDPGRLRVQAATLSGGNQQKLVVGKWLHRVPKILLMDEPTRGIDVGAKAEMLSVVTELANRGMSLIFVSAELEEVLSVADRVVVLAQGRTRGTFDRGEASMARILNLAFGLEDAS